MVGVGVSGDGGDCNYGGHYLAQNLIVDGCKHTEIADPLATSNLSPLFRLALKPPSIGIGS